MSSRNASEENVSILASGDRQKGIRRHGAFGLKLPWLLENESDEAKYHYAEFFTSQIRNKNTRAAYLAAVNEFLDWCSSQNLELGTIDAIWVSAFVEGHRGTAATVKLHLSAIRRFLDFLVTRGVMKTNPSLSVRAPRESLRVGKTPVFTDDELKLVIESIPKETVIQLRDRAILSTLFYTFARVGAVTGIKVLDYRMQGKRSILRLHEKGGKYQPVPVHHKLEEALDLYLEEANISQEKKNALFRSVDGLSGRLTKNPMSRVCVYRMVQRRCKDVGLEGYGCHSFRASGITNFRCQGGSLDTARQLAGHASSETTRLYDRSREEVSQSEIERIRI